MGYESPMMKRVGQAFRDHAGPGPAAPASGEGWIGFVCQECSAPLAVHKSENPSKDAERSARGWRVTCTGCGVTEYYEVGSPMVRITAT